MRRRFLAAGVLLLASLQYFVCTFVVAAAWADPAYDLFDNYISDLGIRTCGPYAVRYVCSPLHEVMNTSLIIQGALTILAAVIGYRLIPRFRGAILTLAFVTGAGIALVGLVPGSIEGGVRAIPVHGLAAFVAVTAGDVMIVLLGLALWRVSKPGSLALIAAALVSAASMYWVTVAPHAILGPGLPERLAIDSFFVVCAVLGVRLLVAGRRKPESAAAADARRDEAVLALEA
ncbi:DUF998 domain-containing protein [Microbacterium sp. BWT-B31]|uniref:DUF998 domain-containing protein n=1 Tax=Microbacterium sp. BWT-B31 TaxID=3232072 RepID=UPI003528A3C1